MWKLKIAEGDNSLYLYSTNNYVGRQVWEYDPNGGTPQELAQIEEARQNFTKNRSDNCSPIERRKKMWKLKVAEGDNSPYLYSTNNFVGRQVWEYDPNAGTPQELAQIEEARQNFTKNRSKVRPASDLLWQFQALKEKNFKQTIPAVRIEQGEEVSYEKATTTLRRSANFFSALQASDGHWPAENSGVLFFLPPFVFTFYITGHLNTIFPEPYKREIFRYIYNHQNEDGGWGLHIESHSNMFCTTFNYVCLRIFGVEPESDALLRARKWIVDHGGIIQIPSWGKTWLSVCDQLS